MDKVDAATRSRMMSSIRGKDTRPEMAVRSYLHAAGLRFRLHVTTMPGRPDLAFPGRRLAVFVHGCFWHRHESCRFAATPSAKADFWVAKFAGNVKRDQRQVRELETSGWRVITFWECESRNELALDELCWRILATN
jgi:DNA mismatch endonuclease (patch repair protein)